MKRNTRAVAGIAALGLLLGCDSDGVTDPGGVGPEPVEPDTRARQCTEGKAGRYPCSGIDLVSYLSGEEIGLTQGIVNDMWGWTDRLTGTEWALVGHQQGTAFVSLKDPERPLYAGILPHTDGAQAGAWRDIKVHRNHAFIVSDGAGPHGMQVFDLTRLRRVADPPETFAATALYDGIHSAHNIVINEETGFAYAVGASGGGNSCGGGLHMIDIRDPGNPAFSGCFADPATGRSGTGYTHDAICVVYRGPDIEHRGREICFGSNETALSIADVSDKAAPAALAAVSYPNAAYAHQGWLDEAHEYLYMNDEFDEAFGMVSGTRTIVWDVRDLDDPIPVADFIGTTKATDHNLYVAGNRMYQSNYHAGLRVVSIAARESPVEIAFFDHEPDDSNEAGLNGGWSNYPFFESGVIGATSIGSGVFFVRMSERN